MPVPNSVPRFPVDRKILDAQLSLANTNRDGTGTIVDLGTAPAQGMVVELIRVVATATTTAGVVRIFIHDGTAYRLYKEILITAVTPSTSVEVETKEFTPSQPLVLQSGHKLAASTHNAETFQVFAHVGEY